MKYLPLLILLILISCSNDQRDSIKTQKTYDFENKDVEMNNAIQLAKDNIDIFINALKSGKESQSNFSLKKPFETPFGHEHIWINNIEINKGTFLGRVDNVPEDIPDLKQGDIIEIELEEITDWYFFENDTLVGGETIKLIRNRMTEEERNEFDKIFEVNIK